MTHGAGGSGMFDPPGRRALVVWLSIVAGLVIAMILLGGATRLTQSGLSMVDWRPIMGVLPPLGEADWQDTFAAYRQFPEFRLRNPEMTLAGFKTIFWFEYAHRLLGRAIGLAFIVPFIVFVWRGYLRGRRLWQAGGLLALGGLQGLIGWWMVKSGLVDRPDVSAVRLAVHLGFALIILVGLIRLALAIRDGPAALSSWQRPAAGLLVLVAILQALSGALVAGNDAGLVHNTFPRMSGAFLPPDLWLMRPGWRNLFENPTTVQFVHRLGALVLCVLVLALAARPAPTPGRRRWAAIAAMLVLAQAGLGIAALLAAVPLAMALAHQAGAVALLGALAMLWHHVGYGTPPVREEGSC